MVNIEELQHLNCYIVFNSSLLSELDQSCVTATGVIAHSNRFAFPGEITQLRLTFHLNVLMSSTNSNDA